MRVDWNGPATLRFELDLFLVNFDPKKKKKENESNNNMSSKWDNDATVCANFVMLEHIN